MNSSATPVPAAPLYFGPADAPWFGWLHAAAGGVASPLAVLISAPLGHEELSTYRGMRQLATALAAAGLPVLRFDHTGWGDSADADADAASEPPAQWLRALQAAADELRARSGATRLAFVGVRMGALLAAQAAAARGDVEALVAVLPLASGRAWLRECKLLGNAAAAAAGPAALALAARQQLEDSAGGTEIGGLVFDAAALGAISALRWPAARCAPHALLIERDDMPAAAQVDASLRSLGVTVHGERWPGLERMTAIAHSSHTPAALVERVVAWLLERAAAPVAAHADAAIAGAPAAVLATMPMLMPMPMPMPMPPPPASARLRVGEGWVEERAVCIGAAPQLAGVLTTGAAPADATARRGLLLLSSGAERRIGPNRLWVGFARERAAAGAVVLRLDLAGVGDSDERPGGSACDNVVYDPRCVADIAAALAWLRAECGVQQCDVAGVCSGAYHAWRAALQGLDVSTVIAVNPLVFHWKPGMSLDPTAHAFGQLAIASGARESLRDPRRWAKLLRGRVNTRLILSAMLARGRQHCLGWARGGARVLGWPLVDDLAAELRSVSRRGARLCFVFSDGEPGPRLLAEQAGRTLTRLRRQQQVQLHQVAAADHTFTRHQSRGALYGTLHPLFDAPAGSPR